ncbi:DUF1232 domain-containing protein [bacterium]|nr:DUF1232 domain-containing protein [bacterium]MBU1936802.1 DUF1232 domain-containing protein [bacterium]
MSGKRLFAKEQIEKIDRTFLVESARKITDADIEKIISKESKILKKFESDGPLGHFSADFVTMNSLIKDYFEKQYTTISRESISVIVYALSYVLNPIDLIPDPISEIGHLDDFAVMAVCIAHVRMELDAYEVWKRLQGG